MNWKQHLAGLATLLFAASAVAQTNSTPVFQFAIFYNSLLEFTWCAPMTVNGRVHANSDIYTGSTCQLTFNGLVTTTWSIRSPAWDGHAILEYTVPAIFNAWYATNIPPLVPPIGATNLHAIIDLPPDGEDPNSALGQQRYYNKANLILLVSNSTVTLTLQSMPADPQATSITANYFPTNSSPTNYVQVTTNFPFLTLTNTFTDQRENDTVKVSDINVAILDKWLLTNKTATTKFPSTAGVYPASNAPNILYVADNRTYTNGQLTAVRLKNGATIPTNMVTIAGSNQPSGFTVTTPNPLYIDGNYNCPDSTTLYSTNTSKVYPASLVSDALTILSQNWVDANSTQTLGSSGAGVRTATTTEINAAILTGNVPSTGSAASQFSGGVHNLPRLLEDWGNGGATTLWLNTSLVNLFHSTRATNQFQTPGVYYYAPTRQFNFNQNFLDPTRLPPGTPTVAPTPPAILVPPRNQSVSAGQTAVFFVVAGAQPQLSYQWLFNGTNIPNATTSTLVITNASASNGGLYSVVLADFFGSLTNFSATLTVNYPPVITSQPVSQAALPGSGVTFSVSADGTAPLSYQWFRDQTNAIAGATGPSLILSNVQPSDAGSYSVSVGNACDSVTSEAANLTVAVNNSAAAVLTAPPAFAGDQFQLTVTGVPGFTYTVEASTDLASWVPLCTNTSPFTFVDADATNFPGRYYRSVYLP
jgi:hypothetical protein